MKASPQRKNLVECFPNSGCLEPRMVLRAKERNREKEREKERAGKKERHVHRIPQFYNKTNNTKRAT